MMRVSNAEEAVALAKEMCRRHPELLKQVGPVHSAKDVALKIFLSEAAASGNITVDGSPHRAGGARASASPTVAAAAAAPTVAVAAPVAPAAPAAPVVKVSNLERCPYCTEPSSRYCKETGRRHETTEERAYRHWRHLYRQLQIASNFIDTARLNKPNTCCEDYSVELDLDP